MHRKVIMQGLMNKFQDCPDIRLIYESNDHHASDLISCKDTKVILIEAAESGYYDTTYCLTLCQQIRKRNPKCKLLMMCPEQDEESVKQVIDVKGKGLIDDFVFYDVTIDYLHLK